MLRVLCLAALLAPAALPAMAADLYIYEHNGSVIDWSVAGDHITASYDMPKESMRRIGVRPGDVVFEGSFDANGVTGVAYLFKPGCPPVSYPVSGGQTAEGVVLRGAAPIRRQGCRVEGYTNNGPNANLLFVPKAR